MIYPVHDQLGNRIGTIISEEADDPNQRWVAYAGQDRRQTFPSWEAARTWIESEAAARQGRA